MQQKKVMEELLGKQLKVEGFFDKEVYHVFVKDRETEKIFKNSKAESLRNALLCLKGTGIPYPLNNSIIDLEEKMKRENRWFMAWEENFGTLFYLSSRSREGDPYFEDILALAVSSACKKAQTEGTIFEFYRKEDRRSVKIVASQGKKVFRSFVGVGNDLAEAAQMAIMATHPTNCRKKRA